MKKYFFYVVVLLVILSCNSEQNGKSTLVKNDSTAYNAATHLFKNFNAHNWQGMANLYADTAEFKDPSLGLGIVKQTRKQTIDKYNELNKIFADIKDSVVAIYQTAKANTVIVEFISKGTATDGSKFELPICSILTTDHKGLIVQDFTYYDNSSNKQ
jgi:hypothetical protein